MDGVGPGEPGQRHQRARVEVRLGQGPSGQVQGEVGLPDVGGGRILGRVDGDRLDPHVVGAPDDPPGDLPPVGHQHPLQWGGRH